MNLETAKHVLSSRGWLRNRPERFREQFLKGARLRRVQAGETLFQLADPATEFLGLADGLLEAHLDPGTGTSRLSFIAHPGWWLGGLALSNGSSRRATVIARSPAVLLSVPRAHVDGIARADGAAWKHVAANIAAHYDSLSMLLLASTHPDPLTRIMVTLCRLHRYNDGATHFPMTQAELAEMAGLSRNTANRALRHLVAGSHVAAGYGWIRIVDPDALSATLSDIWLPEAEAPVAAV